jgi:hypothetical protein
LPLEPFQFGAFEGKRRVASFGWRYDYSQQKLKEAEDLPTWITPVVARVETWASFQPQPFGKCSSPNTTQALELAGIATKRTSIRFSACLSSRPASCGFVARRKAAGNAILFKQNHDLFT